MSNKEKSEGERIYQLKVTLEGIKPPIWRRVHVPADTTLDALHMIIQIVMGWEDYHLHEFTAGDVRFVMPDVEGDLILDPEDIPITGADLSKIAAEGFTGPLTVAEETVTLEQVAPKENTKFDYMYDFGDGWEHEILIEKIMPADPEVEYPLCIKGARACPPEDCGGIGGYAHLLETLQNPKAPDYEDLMEWLGGEFDPETFDLDDVNEQLKDIDVLLAEELLAGPDVGELIDEWIDQLQAVLKEARELPDGYALSFNGDMDGYNAVAPLIPVTMALNLPVKCVLEVGPPDAEVMWLRLTGDKEKIKSLLDMWQISV